MKKNVHSMWKTYTSPTELNEETRYLSLRGARYEVHFGTHVEVQVRCRENSTVYYICKNLGYMWDGPRNSRFIHTR